MTNKQQYVERKKYKKEQIYDAIAKRIREICDLTDSVTSAECLKNTLLRMGYEIICTNDISRYNDRYELIPKFDKTYQIKVPFVSREKENMLLARALCEIQTGIHNDMECKIIARRLLMPKQEFLDQIKKNEDVSGRVNITKVVTDSIDSAALKQEKERLLKRIKEIDHLLNCGE